VRRAADAALRRSYPEVLQRKGPPGTTAAPLALLPPGLAQIGAVRRRARERAGTLRGRLLRGADAH
jgi:hypothetical protein